MSSASCVPCHPILTSILLVPKQDEVDFATLLHLSLGPRFGFEKGLH